MTTEQAMAVIFYREKKIPLGLFAKLVWINIPLENAVAPRGLLQQLQAYPCPISLTPSLWFWSEVTCPWKQATYSLSFIRCSRYRDYKTVIAQTLGFGTQVWFPWGSPETHPLSACFSLDSSQRAGHFQKRGERMSCLSIKHLAPFTHAALLMMYL